MKKLLIFALLFLFGCNHYEFSPKQHHTTKCEETTIVYKSGWEDQAPVCDYRSKPKTTELGDAFVIYCKCPTPTNNEEK